jgi:hypothetical protein
MKNSKFLEEFIIPPHSSNCDKSCKFLKYLLTYKFSGLYMSDVTVIPHLRSSYDLHDGTNEDKKLKSIKMEWHLVHESQSKINDDQSAILEL